MSGTQPSTGLICSPGKFQGEPTYVPYFWEQFLDGGADQELDDGTLLFLINDQDRALFPQLANATRILLWEDANGFVHHSCTEHWERVG